MPLKQIAFDLDTNALKKYYIKGNYHKAYKDIKKYMLYAGFKWQQGSVYTSLKSLNKVTILRVVDNLINKEPWLNICMKDCKQTNIEEESDVNYMFDPNKRTPKNNYLKRMSYWFKNLFK